MLQEFDFCHCIPNYVLNKLFTLFFLVVLFRIIFYIIHLYIELKDMVFEFC